MTFAAGAVVLLLVGSGVVDGLDPVLFDVLFDGLAGVHVETVAVQVRYVDLSSSFPSDLLTVYLARRDREAVDWWVDQKEYQDRPILNAHGGNKIQEFFIAPLQYAV